MRKLDADSCEIDSNISGAKNKEKRARTRSIEKTSFITDIHSKSASQAPPAISTYVSLATFQPKTQCTMCLCGEEINYLRVDVVVPI
jgi:hypothetical protein